MTDGPGQLFEFLGELRQRAGALVAEQRSQEAEPDDPYRGLYVGDEHVDRVLNGPSRAPQLPRLPVVDPVDALGRLVESCGLTDLDVGILVAALAPDLDPGFEKLYVYLNDDITRRRASVGVALRLSGADPAAAEARARLLGGSPLIERRLVEIEDRDRPFLTRSLRVPDRVLQHVLGDETLPSEVRGLVMPTEGWPRDSDVVRLGRVFADESCFIHLHDPTDAGGVDLAASVFAHRGVGSVCIDIGRAGEAGIEPAVVAREVILRGQGLVVAGADRASADLLRALIEDVPWVITVSRNAWDPTVAHRRPLCEEVLPTSGPERVEVWKRALAPAEDTGSVDLRDLDPLRLAPSAIHRVVGAARRRAQMESAPLGLEHLQDAARAESSPGLSRLARRLRPGADWRDLVIGGSTRADLEMLTARVRFRDQVLDEWGLRRRSGHREGVTALFAGGSGTGKTLAAEVVAGDLGLDLYVIDLSTVVDKYVGETEKNLEKIFVQAEGVNGVLFFDEADAIFGKRSEVSDARDRYANTEIAYLLQRIETFDGLAILATNLKANVDEAFLRRLAAVVDFPDPDLALRRRMWDLHLDPVPKDGTIDVAFLADNFAFSGGNVRNAAVSAAYMAAARGTKVGMRELVHAVALEYRKLGRLLDASEFGPWMDLLDTDWNEIVEVA